MWVSSRNFGRDETNGISCWYDARQEPIDIGVKRGVVLGKSELRPDNILCIILGNAGMEENI
jgi:hypothetical protein